MAFGSGAMTNSIDEIGDSDVIFLIGSNPTEAHPVIGSLIKRAVKSGTKLIVADPRKIELAKFADVWLSHEPGTDVALVNGIIHAIIKEGLHDKTFIKERTENFEALSKAVEEYTPEKVSKITKVPAEDIIKAARLYASEDRGAIYYCLGITEHTTGTENVLSLANLGMVTGNIGRKGTGVNPIRGQNNVQGACDMGALPNVYPGYQAVDDLQIKSKFEKAWNTKLSDEIGLTSTQMINSAGDKIKSLYIFGENPVVADPDQDHVIHALENLDFLVVQDIFLTETARYADVVLPGVSFAEKDGTFTNTDRRVQRVNKAVNPVGDVKQDWQIICDLAKYLGYDMEYDHPSQIMDELSSLTPSYGGINYERLDKSSLHWPCPDKNHPGTKTLHVGKFSRGKGKFHPVFYKPPAEKPDKEYDFMLMTGRILQHYNSGNMTRRSTISKQVSKSHMQINSQDAKHLGIKNGDKVRITSRRGHADAIADVNNIVQPKHLYMNFHFIESPANRLTNSELDPISNTPEYKVSAVKVEKL